MLGGADDGADDGVGVVLLESREALDLLRVHEGVGEDQLVHAVLDEEVGLAQGGALVGAQAGVHLALEDGRRLVGLGVGHYAVDGAADAYDGVDVVAHHVLVDEEFGGLDLVGVVQAILADLHGSLRAAALKARRV